jgi:hypothetical protein
VCSDTKLTVKTTARCQRDLGVAPEAAAAALRGGADLHAVAVPQVSRVPFLRA